MMYNMDNYEEYGDSKANSKISKFNSGMLTNFTLNQLWLDFFKAFRNVNYKLSNHNLDCIWVILSSDTNDKEDVAKYTEIEQKLSRLPYLGMPQKNGFQKLDDTDRASMMVQKNILMEKACFLRRMQDKQGKGTAYDDGDDEQAE